MTRLLDATQQLTNLSRDYLADAMGAVIAAEALTTHKDDLPTAVATLSTAVRYVVAAAQSASRTPHAVDEPAAPDRPAGPRPFVLVRDEDVTGVSGTGVVAEGAAFSDGTAVLRWCGDTPTSVVWHDQGIESIERVHGHGGRTRIVWTGDGHPHRASS